VRGVEAKLRLPEVHSGRGLSELEEAWLVQSLYREDELTQPEIARRLNRHKSWVWRRLMLVESLEPEVQAQVRLGLLAPRSAVAVGRLPRGNQRAALLKRHLERPVSAPRPGPRPSRRQRDEADWMSADVLRVHEISARLSARLLARPLSSLAAAAAELLTDALRRLSPVLRSLDEVILRVTKDRGE